MKKNRFLAALATLAIALGVSVVALPLAAAADQPGFICEELDSGKIDTTGDPATVTVTAPAGFLIDGYCVKAGTTKHFIAVDPPAAVVVVDHPIKDSVSHYSLSYVTEVAGVAVPTDAKCVVDDGPADGFYTLDQVTGVGYKVFNGATLLQTYESTGDAGSFTFTVGSYPMTLTIKAFALTGFVLEVGATAEWSHTFDAAGDDCNDVKAVAGDPTPTEARCPVPKSESSEVALAATAAFYTIVEAEGVGYYVYVNNVLVDTITSTLPYGPVKFTVTSYPSTVKIQAFALPGYFLDGAAQSLWQHTFVFNERLCQLGDLATVTPVVDQDPPTCTQSGRFFLGGDGVEWLTSPGGVPVAAGWHNVPSATTLTFQAVPGPDNGIDSETQTVFVFEFLAAPLECLDLDTLALTGNEGVPLFLGGAAALLLLGAASIFFARRRTL